MRCYGRPSTHHATQNLSVLTFFSTLLNRIDKDVAIELELDFIPVSEDRVHVYDHLIFGFRESASLDVGPQIVCPSQSTALATPQQTC